MAGINKNINYERLVLRLLGDALPEKHREVVMRRFGIGQDDRETLEEIGKSYDITRERVRQIESAALEAVRRDEHLNALALGREALKTYVDTQGFVVPERKLFADVGSHTHRPSILFILTIAPEFHFYPESERFHSSWATDKDVYERVAGLLDTLHAYFKERNEVTSENEFQQLLRKETRGRNLGSLAESYLGIAKTIQRTPEGHYGLSGWAEVAPRGVRDKSYIVLKKRGEPLHFRDISDLINATTFLAQASSRVAHPQTVHNELIKDDRFVLVGRGMYALGEWGYDAGTVKEVIRRVLETGKAPLAREELVRRVLKQRLVKENTIVLNLQDKTMFRRLPSGDFTLVD